jgi:hypothetical protein
VGVYGRCMDGCRPAVQELLRLPSDGVGALACGAHSSAAISGDGRLFMWVAAVLGF